MRGDDGNRDNSKDSVVVDEGFGVGFQGKGGVWEEPHWSGLRKQE